MIIRDAEIAYFIYRVGETPEAEPSQDVHDQLPAHESPKQVPYQENDVALYVRENITDDDRYNLMKNHFKPDEKFKFPYTRYSNKQRAFNYSWLERYPGLVYSPSADGAFCLPCMFFRAGAERQGTLVTEPYKNWKKATEKFDEHFHGIRHNRGDFSTSSHKKTGTGNQLHMECVTKSTSFMQVFENKTKPVDALLDQGLQDRMEKNADVLKSIVETVMLCGHQNFALRGHRDDSKHEEDPTINTGNFKALLKYRANGGDAVLQQHLANAPRNATYVSKTTQNEIITLIGNRIQTNIIKECNAAGGFFAISADEVRDISNQEQLSVVIRFVDADKHIREEFVCFLNVTDGTTGENISQKLLDFVHKSGLDASKMRSQCYDGASNMSGKTKGVGARIQNEYPKALPFWCTAHQLNRCIVQASNIPAVRNMMGAADQVVRFFEFSPKKENTLLNVIKSKEKIETQKSKLKELCRTRWVERHQALDNFIELLPAVVETLETYSQMPNTRTPGAPDASSLLHSICNFDFIICLIIVRACLSYMQGLSKSLQERTLDVSLALKNVNVVRMSIQECRDKAELYHGRWFSEATNLANSLDVSVNKPRTCRRQTQRANMPAETVEEYYRKAVAIPFLDHLLQEMNSRFSDLHEKATLGLMLVPSELAKLDSNATAEEGFSYFFDDLPSPQCLSAEIQQWKMKWSQSESKPSTISAAIKQCDEIFFQNIYTILKICATFPVTSCECERSISVLRLLKTYLRSTMGQERMTSLALMYIHRDMEVKETDIVSDFARSHPRKMKLPNILFSQD